MCAKFMGSQDRIPPRAQVFSGVFCGLCDDLITGTEESYRVCLIACNLETSKRGTSAQVGLLCYRKK